MEGFELGEELVGLAVLTTSTAFLGPLIVLVDVLELLLAFLGTSSVSEFT